MKKIVLKFLIMTGLTFVMFAQDAETILRQLDKNQIYSTARYNGELNILISGKKYDKTFNALSSGNNNFFMEFTNSDDEGTRYLKKDGNIYVYSPDVEEIMPITGHMLKESMMGSDLSYEDMTDNEKLWDIYNVSIVEDTPENWVIELIAKKKSVSYPKKKIWVRKSDFTPMQEEWFALSGSILKRVKINKIEKIKDKNFPTEIEIIDLIRKNSKTVFIMKDVELDVKVDPSVFTMQNLEK